MNLCFSKFGPVRLQVVNDAIQSSGQSDSMGQKNHQNQVGEQSCKIHDLERKTEKGNNWKMQNKILDIVGPVYRN